MSPKRENELLIIKELVHNESYGYSAKVRKFMADGWYSHEDLEHCICTAARIHKTEKDEKGESTDGCKYTILGNDTEGYRFYTCGKFMATDDGEVYFFITAHEAE